MQTNEKKHPPIRERIAALKLAIRWTYNSSKPLTYAIFAIAIIGGLLTLLEPWIFKLIIDRITAGTSLSDTARVSIGIISILVLYGAARITQSMLWDIQTLIKKVHSQKLDRYTSLLMMDKISSLDATYFEDPKYYNTLTKATQSLWRINEFFWQFTFLIGQLVGIIAIIGALFTLHWIIVVLVIAASLPSLFLVIKKSTVTWGIFDSYSPISRQANYYKSLLTERPEAIKEIKLFGLKPHFIGQFESLISIFIKKQEKAVRQEFGKYFLMVILEGIFSVLAAWFIIRAFLRSEISIGQFTFFWALLFQFSEHVRWVVRLTGDLYEHSLFITPFVKIFTFKPSIVEHGNPRAFPNKMKQGIEFRNVTFYYPGAKKPSLQNFTASIKSGESVALVGENGSGKTTLIKLLTRLYDATEGEILIDGINIKEYSIQDLHENIGVIFQDFMKYDAALKDNIGFGKLKYLKNKGKVHSAAIKSGAWEFVKSLEQQYETHLGKTLNEEGTELSVGQWQKIALARAFFKDAEILCLDEPTAAVDAKAEYELFKKFEHLTKEKTTLLISHRFSTVRMAHKIIVMERGKISEQGSHRELLRKNGLYAKMFRMQAEGYK
ncbi:MAG TPA: ABC transporter ATP-binding protein [Candidatus Nanoarchaeia archaeon]|nr:ABC transporter ATP-binding protein [Candidatus Nanoarchaeia archaeon]